MSAKSYTINNGNIFSYDIRLYCKYKCNFTLTVLILQYFLQYMPNYPLKKYKLRHFLIRFLFLFIIETKRITQSIKKKLVS